MNLAYDAGPFNVNVAYTRFSKVELQDFQWVDSPATNQSEANALFQVATDIYDAKGVLDISVGYDISDRFKLTIGSNNLFNTYPTPQFDGWTDQGGFNDSVQMGSDGAFFFGRLGFNF